jgi:serine protease Do
MEVKMETKPCFRSYEKFNFFHISAFILLFFISPLTAVAQDKESIATLRQMGKAFASIAETASPAVVSIKAESTVVREYSQFPDTPFGSPFGDDFFDYFFRRRSPRQNPEQRRYREPRVAQGSGFIVSSDGYILTNNHVVNEAEKVEVELTDGRQLTAEIKGTEPESDVAVIKIDAENLPYLELANSDTLEVGEWVLAIGNPLGLSHTVTAGIVSAKGRAGFGLAKLENFIQTDAAINFGNSGGPLINLDGKVVGMNTAIAGSTGNIGIGFAIPINMAKYAYDQIVESGKVERGMLGVSGIVNLTPDNATFFGLDEDTKGVLVPNVMENSAAEKAGVKVNDVILEVNGEPVETVVELQNRISMLRPGTKVELTIWRDGRKRQIDVTLGKRSEAETASGNLSSQTVEDLGFSVENLTDELRQRYSYENMNGVVITDVVSGSDADRNGITPGTLIREVNQQPVRNTQEFNEAINRAKSRGTGRIMLLVNIEGTNYYVFLRLPG